MGQSTTTLATALTTVRTFLDEPANPAVNFWSDSQLTAYMNIGCAEIQRRSEAIQKLGTVLVTSGQQTYTAPADVLRIYRVQYQPLGIQQIYPLERRGYNEMDEVWGLNQAFQGAWPGYFTMWGAPPNITLTLYPIPANNGTLSVFYYPTIVPVAAPTDTLDVLPEWESLVYDYTVYRARRQDADPRSKDDLDLFMENLSNMIEMTRAFSDQGNFITHGTANVPAWLAGEM